MRHATPRGPHFTALAGALLIASTAVLASAANAPNPAPLPLDNLIPSVAVKTHGVHVVPLIDRRAPGARALLPARPEHLVVHPHDGDRVRIHNQAEQPVLLLAGSVLTVRGQERLVRNTSVLTAGATERIDTLRTSTRRRHASDAAVSRIERALAPRFVRERFLRGTSIRGVQRFLARFEDWLPPSPGKHIVPRIRDLDTALRGDRAQADLPNSLLDPRTVGFATVVNDRVESLQLFASNDLLRAHAPMLLRAHAYKLRALDARGSRLGLVASNEADPLADARSATKLVRDLLADLAVKTHTEAIEASAEQHSSFSIRYRGLRGHIVRNDTTVLHAVLYPHAPYDVALFAGSIRPAPEASSFPAGNPELQRRVDRGTATEAERRILERRARLRR